MEDYIAGEDADFSLQLVSSGQGFQAHGILLGFTQAEIDDAVADGTLFAYIMDRQTYHQGFGQDFTAYKNLARHGKDAELLTAPVPEPNTNPLPLPTVTAANIEDRFRKRANRAKAHPAYTTAIGEDLKIVKPATVFDPETGTPTFKIKLSGTHPHLKLKKGGWDGVEIYRLVTGKASMASAMATPEMEAAFQKLERVFGSEYVDPSPLPAFGKSEVWHYKMMYIYKNELVGTMSDIVSISITGV